MLSNLGTRRAARFRSLDCNPSAFELEANLRQIFPSMSCWMPSSISNRRWHFYVSYGLSDFDGCRRTRPLLKHCQKLGYFEVHVNYRVGARCAWVRFASRWFTYGINVHYSIEVEAAALLILATFRAKFLGSENPVHNFDLEPNRMTTCTTLSSWTAPEWVTWLLAP